MPDAQPPSDDGRNSISVAVGKNLKRLRIAAEKSQETVAVDAQVDRTYISEIERGAANPSIVTLAHICHALNLTLADFFTDLRISEAPSESARRSNAAKPQPREKKSRFR